MPPPTYLAWEGLPRALREHYSLVDYLGKGATSVVFRAIQEELDREVVVKVLTDLEEDTRERSFREAAILARLRHPNVIRLFDFGDQPDLIYLVLEYLPGRALESGGPYDRPAGDRLIELALGIARGLAAIHDAGVVHRDLKPSNIWITEEGVPKILDFGLARDSSHDRTSAGGLFKGTLSHASPEQIRSEPLDGRSDLYALGVILYQMVTGQNPFIGESVADTIDRHLEKQITRLPADGSILPAGLERLILDLLQKDRDRRPPSAHEVVRRLETMRKASIAIDIEERPSGRRRRAVTRAIAEAPLKARSVRSKIRGIVTFLLALFPVFNDSRVTTLWYDRRRDETSRRSAGAG